MSDRKLSIVFVQDHDNSTLRLWNTDDTAESLRSQGYNCESVFLPTHRDKLADYDIVIFYRSLSQDYDALIASLKKKGVIIGFFIDDLLWDKNFSFAYHPSFESRTKRFFAMADFFLFTSDYLARYAPQNKPILHRRPALLERRFDAIRTLAGQNRLRSPDFRILISKGHVIPEFKRLVLQIFEHCQPATDVKVFYFSTGEKTYPDKIGRFSFQKFNHEPFDVYMMRMAAIKPDLIIIPMPDDEFHKCKCYPKYLEAGAVGSCLLASSVYPYQQAIKNMTTGLLANNIHDFSAKITWATENRGLVSQMGENAANDVKENHLLGPIALKLYQDLFALYGNKPIPLPPPPKEPIGPLVPGMFQDKHNGNFGEIYGPKTIAQEFICDQENLCRIDVYGSTFRRLNNGAITLNVKSEMLGPVIRTVTIDTNRLPDNDWYTFEFDPIPSSRGQKYCFSLDAKSASPGNAITLFYLNHTFGFGKLYYNGKHMVGCLRFRVFYKF